MPVTVLPPSSSCGCSAASSMLEQAVCLGTQTQSASSICSATGGTSSGPEVPVIAPAAAHYASSFAFFSRQIRVLLLVSTLLAWGTFWRGSFGFLCAGVRVNFLLWCSSLATLPRWHARHFRLFFWCTPFRLRFVARPPPALFSRSTFFNLLALLACQAPFRLLHAECFYFTTTEDGMG